MFKFIEKIKFANNANKAYKEVKKVIDDNKETANYITDLAKRFIELINDAKAKIPAITEFANNLIDIVKKYFINDKKDN